MWIIQNACKRFWRWSQRGQMETSRGWTANGTVEGGWGWCDRMGCRGRGRMETVCACVEVYEDTNYKFWLILITQGKCCIVVVLTHNCGTPLPNWPRFPGSPDVISHRGVQHVWGSAGHEQQEAPSLVRLLPHRASAGISECVSDGVSERLPLSWNVAKSSVKQTFAAAAATIKPRHH